MNILRKLLQNRFFNLLFWSLMGFVLGLSLVFIIGNFFKPKYAMVVLDNGNIYFGEISFFPRLKLKFPVFVNVDNNGNVSLQRFTEAVWRPKDYIFLNQSKILFWTYLEDNSPVADFVKRKSQVLATSTPGQTQNNQNFQQFSTSTTSTQR